MENLLDETHGELLLNAAMGADDRDQCYVGPYVYLVEEEDVILKEEVS